MESNDQGFRVENKLEKYLGVGFSRIPSELQVQRLKTKYPETLDIPNSIVPDRLTELPQLTDWYRNQLVAELTDAIRTQKPFLFIYSDADQLKRANDIARKDLGDGYIQFVASQSAQVLLRSGVSLDKSHIFRNTVAADEVVTIIFDPTSEEMQRIKQSAQETYKSVFIPDYNFTYSISHVIISSDDPRLQSLIEETRQKLISGEIKAAYTTYQAIQDLADEIAKSRKISQSLKRMDVQGLSQTDAENLRVQLENTYGGGRTSTPEIRQLHMLSFLAGARFVAKHPELAPDLLKSPDPLSLAELNKLYKNLVRDPTSSGHPPDS